MEIASLIREREPFSSGKDYLLPGYLPRFVSKEQQNKNLLNSGKF